MRLGDIYFSYPRLSLFTPFTSLVLLCYLLYRVAPYGLPAPPGTDIRRNRECSDYICFLGFTLLPLDLYYELVRKEPIKRAQNQEINCNLDKVGPSFQAGFPCPNSRQDAVFFGLQRLYPPVVSILAHFLSPGTRVLRHHHSLQSPNLRIYLEEPQ